MKKHIPNLFTFGNLFCGYLSISYIMNNDARNATILIFIAIMLDAVDGRVARILGVSNPIGKELDSLADIVSFGVAPAFLAAHTYFSDFHIYGIMMAGLFPVFGSYRLARFNITSSEESLKHFSGIPITLAGGIVTFLVLLHNYIHTGLFLILFYALCFLMVSTVRIPSFKKIGLPKNSMLITLFIFYMVYLAAKTKFEQVPFFFYVALGTYILFIVVRYMKEKETRITFIKMPLPKRLKIKGFKFRGKKRKPK
ncbi:CDP-diacylglycerol--serine O-phosphatidyltransferase [Mesobacillus zeae]|uniref:CDP-diacylglycerol--serine O-phosphatidyltransferase n=1 Tax=Mesobacillus zeae TaxID=1917180 RepID=A0A398BE09_9BACI|nr:CDP-diacylglycerol--serine O-phosphatidyltransferase [Mesobacillus zeae]RID85816.1 CDP-diacylglycerol--serine O-phosphatidyltransferase [Mesobacillus zeae]